MAWLQMGDWLMHYIEQHGPANHVSAYIEFHHDAELRQGKKWSRFGALQCAQPRDRRQWTMGESDWFDPGNRTYKRAVQEVDSTSRIANEIGLTEQEAVADIVKGFIGLQIAVDLGKGPGTDTVGKRDEWLYENVPLTLEEIAKFWTTVAYAVYHINIVKNWIETTQTTACLAAERTMESMSAQRLAASPGVYLRERGSHESNDVDMEKILRVDLFHLVAGLMSCWYKDLPMHYVEEHIASYLSAWIRSMKNTMKPL